jgi:hypothetical protein
VTVKDCHVIFFRNLIDTSTTLAQLGEKDAMERAKDYRFAEIAI